MDELLAWFRPSITTARKAWVMILTETEKYFMKCQTDCRQLTSTVLVHLVFNLPFTNHCTVCHKAISR